jgi:hypothetical protein
MAQPELGAFRRSLGRHPRAAHHRCAPRVDKISDTDFEELNEKLRAQARQVLHELDAGVESFRDEAEALIAERLADEA